MLRVFLAALLSFAFGSSAFAVGPDMSGLTSAVDFGTVTVAVLAIAGMLAVVYVAVKGASIGLAMLRSK
ncbi:MAG: hypothetical protein Q8L15_01560 [Methylobacter sp.]|jgi:hypothetical protein|nr:hypothetical protein [Methylobacter sp.]